MIVGFIVVDANINDNDNEELTNANIKEREGIYFDEKTYETKEIYNTNDTNDTNEEKIYEQILKIMEKNYYHYGKFTTKYYKTYETEKNIKYYASSSPIPIPIPITKKNIVYN